MFLLAFGRRGLGLTHRVDADSDSREYIPTADSPSCSPFYCFPNPPVPLSLTYHGATRTPPAAPRCTRGTPLARRTSWHRHSSRTSHLMASRQSAISSDGSKPCARGGRLSEQSKEQSGSIGPCWSPRGFREPPKPALDSPSPGEYQRDERASDRRVARPRVKPRLSKTAALARRPLHTTAARCHS